MDETQRELEFFHREIDAFIKRYDPRDGQEFALELRILLSRAFAMAQKPFIYELNRHRDLALEASLLNPMGISFPAEGQAQS